MPTVYLNTVDPPYFIGTNTLDPPQIVGSNPWNDISTGNYTESWSSVRSTGGQRTLAVGDLPPVDIPAGGLIDSVDFTAIIALINQLNGSGVRWGIDILDMTGDPFDEGHLAMVTNTPGEARILAPAADGTFYTVDFIGGVAGEGGFLSPIDGDPLSVEYVTDIFRNGCRIAVKRYDQNPPLPHDHGIKVAYLVGVLHWTAGVTPPLRHTQRDDARNSGLTSRQRSLRNTGYL